MRIEGCGLPFLSLLPWPHSAAGLPRRIIHLLLPTTRQTLGNLVQQSRVRVFPPSAVLLETDPLSPSTASSGRPAPTDAAGNSCRWARPVPSGRFSCSPHPMVAPRSMTPLCVAIRVRPRLRQFTLPATLPPVFRPKISSSLLCFPSIHFIAIRNSEKSCGL